MYDCDWVYVPVFRENDGCVFQAFDAGLGLFPNTCPFPVRDGDLVVRVPVGAGEIAYRKLRPGETLEEFQTLLDEALAP